MQRTQHGRFLDLLKRLIRCVSEVFELLMSFLEVDAQRKDVHLGGLIKEVAKPRMSL